MKVYHLIIAVIIVTFITAAFTSFGAGDGLLNNLKSNYNSDINTSVFTPYDAQDSINDLAIQDTINNADLTDTDVDDTEDSLLSTATGILTDMGRSFITAYNMLTSFTTATGLPKIVFWAASSLLAIFVLLKTAGWLINR